MISSAEEFVRLRLSDRKEDYDRAAHEEASLEVWWEVVREHPDMKRWVVHNKTVPLAILEALSTDEDPRIRSAVAGKRKASAAILKRLAADHDSGVRNAVAWNAKTPRAILETMLVDERDAIVEHVKQRLAEDA